MTLSEIFDWSTESQATIAILRYGANKQSVLGDIDDFRCTNDEVDWILGSPYSEETTKYLIAEAVRNCRVGDPGDCGPETFDLDDFVVVCRGSKDKDGECIAVYIKENDESAGEA